jgi:hypothetical protein
VLFVAVITALAFRLTRRIAFSLIAEAESRQMSAAGHER